MTTQKSLKKRVRTRMEKTGESYTAARRQVTKPVAQPAPEPTPAPQPSAVRGMRDTKGAEENVRANTGRGWDEWFVLLDQWGAATKAHKEIAKYLYDDLGVDGWWAQGVTIAYEQARGLRVPGQTSAGFTAGGTKTVNVPAAQLFSAFAEESVRSQWLPDAPLSVRVARSPKSFRADWVTDRGTASRLHVVIDTLGESKSRAAISHERLADADEIAELKAFWKARLGDLKTLLESA